MNAGTAGDRNDPLKKALTHALAIWAIAAPLWVLAGSALSNTLAVDVQHAFLPAARAVLHGASPYSAIGSRAVLQGTAFLYPPLSAYLFVPFTLLPQLAAEIVAVLLVAAAVPATLLVLGVRDWRCYATAFLWWPTIIGMQTGNLTLPMLLGVALAWRYRDRPIVVALVSAIVVALKLFFWPLFVWLVATRRYRAAALSAGATVLFVLVPWAGIGFAGLRWYPHLLASVSREEGPRSYSVAALLHAVIPNWTAAVAVETLFGTALLAGVLAAGRRGRDRDAFALSIVAILVLTPLLEMHYLALLLVIVALYRRSFALAWAAPLLIWGAAAGNVASLIQIVHVLLAVAITVVLARSDWRPQALVRVLRLRRKAASPTTALPGAH
jgi:hypothetical protein